MGVEGVIKCKAGDASDCVFFIVGEVGFGVWELDGGGISLLLGIPCGICWCQTN
ncbi:unnamed protein product [Meloidogyne enterolobii]|uniref:Uncharacterized protein n=1 Tax=Meloidogyne enterolobii TaxID=390850 RepID=A0ACB0ZPC7_MELEN